MSNKQEDNPLPASNLIEALSTPPTPPPPGITLMPDQIVTSSGQVVQLGKKPRKWRITLRLKADRKLYKKPLESKKKVVKRKIILKLKKTSER